MAHGGLVLGAAAKNFAMRRFSRFVGFAVNQGSIKSTRTQHTLQVRRLLKISKTTMLGRLNHVNARIASGLGEGSA